MPTDSIGIIGESALCRLCRERHKRHSFAVNRLLRWYREGADVQSRLPVLSTFLGHVDVHSTQVYLTVTADLLRAANERFQQQFGRVAPGVTPRGSHRSVRARLRHTARQGTGSPSRVGIPAGCVDRGIE